MLGAMQTTETSPYSPLCDIASIRYSQCLLLSLTRFGHFVSDISVNML